MPDLAHLLQQGSANLWLFIPSAILLGALHGLEPGHSKTMMAAFIVAVRGTAWQAALLGLSATVSHTAVVWLVALGGLYFGRNLNLARSEPYFQLGSAAIILGVAAWMAWRTWREQQPHHDDHHHEHDHDHHDDAHQRAHAEEIRRRFAGNTGRHVTTGQIVAFGLTGGLIPCPASITVLLVCLQLKQIALGAALVLCFSLGLAVTMVSVGVAAALGMRHAETRWGDAFGMVARRAPYASAVLITLVAFALAAQALSALQ